MTFTESIQTCFSKYADFNGRATRSEFWWWVLFVILATVAANILNDKLGILISLGTLLPYIAVTARRLHDTNRSGWWQLIGIIPVIGWIIMIVWCAQESASQSEYA
jgi:uncharacterized membrane protein YhaH (DUF805 family)